MCVRVKIYVFLVCKVAVVGCQKKKKKVLFSRRFHPTGPLCTFVLCYLQPLRCTGFFFLLWCSLLARHCVRSIFDLFVRPGPTMAGSASRIPARAEGLCGSLMEKEKAFKHLPGRHKGHAIMPAESKKEKQK